MINSIKKTIKSTVRLIRIAPGDKMFWTGREKNCPNFGDLIGPYLFEKITGKRPRFTPTSNLSINCVFMSAGSIMSWCRENSVIWGSGIVYRGQKFPKPQAVYAVRGPITRDHFIEQGYDCPKVYGDPGLLMPLFYNPKNKATKNKATKNKIGVVPHYVDKKISKRYIIENDSLIFIDVFKPIENVIDEILSCEVIISSSLHGLIIAHAYNMPAIWCKFSENLWGDDVKFQDHFLSLDISDVNPVKIDKILDLSELDFICRGAIAVDPLKLSKIQKELLKQCPFRKGTLPAA